VEKAAGVLVVTGMGGMGLAVARRLGPGRTVLAADVKPGMVNQAAEHLRGEGYDVVGQEVDVSVEESVRSLAKAAAGLGQVEVVVHTAGLSPVQAAPEAVLRVDLLGTAFMLDAFAEVMAPGGAGVFIASNAGTMTTLDPDLERRLATTPTRELLAIPEVAASAQANPYGFAKRANQLRVRAASLVWARRRARVNSISPGIIATPMSNDELAGPSGEMMRGMIATSATGRIGTPQDIAAAAEFLAGPHSTFVTGTDLLVDGGEIAGMFWSGLQLLPPDL
jgi:NAD(P)-dependent dehydrogenase (short-subunit alcohol dehydrogenase family)